MRSRQETYGRTTVEGASNESCRKTSCGCETCKTRCGGCEYVERHGYLNIQWPSLLKAVIIHVCSLLVQFTMSDALKEELEVLESIYPTEVQKKSDTHIEIEAEGDDVPDGSFNVKVTLVVHYPPAYPEELPELTLSYDDPNMGEGDGEKLIAELLKVGTENLGMAMTFTLVTHLREHIGVLIRSKIDLQKKIDAEKEQLAIEEEEKRTRGTLVTRESFMAWKVKFDKEVSTKKALLEEEKLRSLSPKDREEWKRAGVRLTGRQLFEKNRNLEDETIVEEGAVSVDFSQYERTTADETEEEGLSFSDSE